MIHFSFAAFLMTIVYTSLTIVIIIFAFNHNQLLLTLGYKLISLLVLFSTLRLLLPVEFAFAKPIALSSFKSISNLVDWVNQSVWILKVIEIIGVLCLIVAFFRAITTALTLHVLYHKLDQPSMYVSKKQPYAEFLDSFNSSLNHRAKVLLMPLNEPPKVIGYIHPLITISLGLDLTPKDIYYILYHETSHCKHRDILTKLFFNMLQALYWWNPFVFTMYNKVCELLELRIDSSIVNNNPIIAEEYFACIRNIASQYPISPQKYMRKQSELSLSLYSEDQIILNKRQELATLSIAKKSPVILQTCLILLSILVFLGSYCIRFV